MDRPRRCGQARPGRPPGVKPVGEFSDWGCEAFRSGRLASSSFALQRLDSVRSGCGPNQPGGAVALPDGASGSATRHPVGPCRRADRALDLTRFTHHRRVGPAGQGTGRQAAGHESGSRSSKLPGENRSGGGDQATIRYVVSYSEHRASRIRGKPHRLPVPAASGRDLAQFQPKSLPLEPPGTGPAPGQHARAEDGEGGSRTCQGSTSIPGQRPRLPWR